MTATVDTYLGLGGNVGDVRAAMNWAVAQIGGLPTTSLTAVSSLYRTPPWGITTQNWFLNACLAVRTELTPHSLLRAVIDVEEMAGRKRDIRWGPRTLDIDVLAYGKISIWTPDLIIPHPRMTERAFVIVPLCEIAPHLSIAGREVADIAAQFVSDNVEVEATDWVEVAG